MKLAKGFVVVLSCLLLVACSSSSKKHDELVSDETIASQRESLKKNTQGKGFGPQSPRDIDKKTGANSIVFESSPDYKKMNLCNIHFHKSAEHKGGEFTRFAGNGDGHGFESGFLFSGELSAAEKSKVDRAICAGKHGDVNAGDTIEVHYVHSSAMVSPGATLGACLSDSIKNPQLRVEAQVYVLVNDSNAADFMELTKVGEVNGFHQALNIPAKTGKPTTYAGSTTGPGYNEAGSPFQVTWSVRPKVMKVNVTSVETWCKGNVFKEDHAHGVRNLVENPDLLSPIN